MGWWSAKVMRIVGVETRIEGVRPTRFIAKGEIRDWPIAGWIAERAGTIFIRRERRRDTARINQQVAAALTLGDCVGLFPEGTTTEGDQLLKFHSSLFEPAVANRAHVHPCAIRYENADGSVCRAMAFVGELSFMQSLGLVIRQRGVVARVRFAPTVETADSTRREVASQAEARVAGLLSLSPSGTPSRTPPDRRASLP